MRKISESYVEISQKARKHTRLYTIVALDVIREARR
jgi:hypothetical protein